MKMLMEKGVEALAGLVRWVRGERVILDADLARLYGVETRALNRAVRRNVKRFPPDFMFMLVNEEVTNLKCQIGISSSGWGGRGGGRGRLGIKPRQEYGAQTRDANPTSSRGCGTTKGARKGRGGVGEDCNQLSARKKIQN